MRYELYMDLNDGYFIIHDTIEDMATRWLESLKNIPKHKGLNCAYHKIAYNLQLLGSYNEWQDDLSELFPEFCI